MGLLKDPNDNPSNVVPAGDYALYLLADGAPVRVTLRLHGLRGSTTLTPPAYGGLQIRTLTQGFALGHRPSQPSWSASGTGSIGKRGGIVANNLLIEGSTYAGGVYDVCLATGNPPRPEPVGCPASGSLPLIDLKSRPSYQAGLILADVVRDNVWSAEAYYLAAALVRDANAATFWLSF
jgi:hypothetical protein